MARLAVALACAAAGVSAFMAPSVQAPAKTVVYGKGGELRDRIATVGNTQKITEAMRLVAAAKVRRAQEAVLQTRPFSETLQSVFLGLIDQLGKEPIDIPLLETREVKKVTLLAMSGDRGLCGSYNTYIIKKTEARKQELEAQGIEVEIVPVGTKVAGYFRRRGVEFPSEYNCPQVPTAEFAAAVSSEMLNKFLDGETDKVELIYTQFVSLIASAPKLKTLLPLSKTGLEAAEDEMFELTTDRGLRFFLRPSSSPSQRNGLRRPFAACDSFRRFSSTKRTDTAHIHQGQQTTTFTMEHKIVISGEGSAHPKLGVKKKNSVEENLKILNDMIESGKLSLDHAIAKTKSNGTLRGIFKCSEDEEMAAHVDALYDFVVAYKKRLVPDFDPAAPVKKVQKEAVGFPPVVEAAKSGRATCKISQEKIEKDELRVGLPVFARGQQVTSWAKASEFSKALRFETAPDNRSKCKASKEKITAGEIRLCARVGSAAELEANAGEKAKMYYNPMAIKPFWKAYHEATGVRPSDIAGAELLDEAYHKALLDANEDERYEEADC